MESDHALSKMGLHYTVLDSGCCGMAGGFGFESAHYDVSIKAGERVLLPAVRRADKDTLIIANGFSCREQIAQTTDRQALHLAQVIQMAMREGASGPGTPYPEKKYERAGNGRMSFREAAILIGAGMALAGGVRAFTKRKRWL